MSFALSSGVSGLGAHQKMLDVAGNDLANVNTVGYKGSRIVFSELLSQTMKKASQPTSTIGGVNPQQIGTGVGIAGISPNTAQGNLEGTNNPLDLAIEGEGYFVLSDGSQSVYSRAGAFAVDANSHLVDPATGRLVQRIDTVGESDGFQIPGDSNIRIPYEVALAASATSEMNMTGNVSADAAFTTPQTNVLRSDIAYTIGGVAADTTTEIDQLDQFSGTASTGRLYVTGVEPDGTVVTDATGLLVDGSTTIAALLTYIDSKFPDSNVTASLSNDGEIVVTDDSSGFSKTDIALSYTPAGTESLTVPGYFKIPTVGGDEVRSFNTIVYDSQGGQHVLSGALVRTDTVNTWDMVLTSISGSVSAMTFDNRRIEGIEFSGSDGSYAGLNSTTGDTAQLAVTFAHDTSSLQIITVGLGTVGQYDGLTQFARVSTAVAKEQNGYGAGDLTSVSVSNDGVVIGAFSNGIKKDLAAIQLALFKNPSGLESIGGGFFIPSVNSGDAVATQALIGGAGTIHGGTLEKSNVDIASLFVDMIQAQNGYNANARTIRIANEMLRELTGIIR